MSESIYISHHALLLEMPTLSWYGLPMEKTPFELTPEQKSLLASLALETGKPIPALIAEALQRLQEQEHLSQAQDDSARESAKRPRRIRKPIWEKFIEASRQIPDEELDRLPTDLAAQVDHYVYGTPKR
jgi:hypothetical protein